MNALSMYVHAAHIVFQKDTSLSFEQRVRDLNINMPILRQMLSCAVCQNLLNDPYAHRNARCQHNVCRLCVQGRKSLRPPCTNCKDSHDYKTYDENIQFTRLLVCYKSLCERIMDSELFSSLSKNKVRQVFDKKPSIMLPNMSAQEFILEGAQYGSFSFVNAFVPRLATSSNNTTSTIGAEVTADTSVASLEAATKLAMARNEEYVVLSNKRHRSPDQQKSVNNSSAHIDNELRIDTNENNRSDQTSIQQNAVNNSPSNVHNELSWAAEPNVQHNRSPESENTVNISPTNPDNELRNAANEDVHNSAYENGSNNNSSLCIPAITQSINNSSIETPDTENNSVNCTASPSDIPNSIDTTTYSDAVPVTKDLLNNVFSIEPTTVTNNNSESKTTDITIDPYKDCSQEFLGRTEKNDGNHGGLLKIVTEPLQAHSPLSLNIEQEFQDTAGKPSLSNKTDEISAVHAISVQPLEQESIHIDKCTSPIAETNNSRLNAPDMTTAPTITSKQLTEHPQTTSIPSITSPELASTAISEKTTSPTLDISCETMKLSLIPVTTFGNQTEIEDKKIENTAEGSFNLSCTDNELPPASIITPTTVMDLPPESVNSPRKTEELSTRLIASPRADSSNASIDITVKDSITKDSDDCLKNTSEETSNCTNLVNRKEIHTDEESEKTEVSENIISRNESEPILTNGENGSSNTCNLFVGTSNISSPSTIPTVTTASSETILNTVLSSSTNLKTELPQLTNGLMSATDELEPIVTAARSPVTDLVIKEEPIFPMTPPNSENLTPTQLNETTAEDSVLPTVSKTIVQKTKSTTTVTSSTATMLAPTLVTLSTTPSTDTSRPSPMWIQNFKNMVDLSGAVQVPTAFNISKELISLQNTQNAQQLRTNVPFSQTHTVSIPNLISIAPKATIIATKANLMGATALTTNTITTATTMTSQTVQSVSSRNLTNGYPTTYAVQHIAGLGTKFKRKVDSEEGTAHNDTKKRIISITTSLSSKSPSSTVSTSSIAASASPTSTHIFQQTPETQDANSNSGVRSVCQCAITTSSSDKLTCYNQRCPCYAGGFNCNEKSCKCYDCCNPYPPAGNDSDNNKPQPVAPAIVANNVRTNLTSSDISSAPNSCKNLGNFPNKPSTVSFTTTNLDNCNRPKLVKMAVPVEQFKGDGVKKYIKLHPAVPLHQIRPIASNQNGKQDGMLIKNNTGKYQFVLLNQNQQQLLSGQTIRHPFQTTVNMKKAPTNAAILLHKPAKILNAPFQVQQQAQQTQPQLQQQQLHSHQLQPQRTFINLPKKVIGVNKAIYPVVVCSSLNVGKPVYLNTTAQHFAKLNTTLSTLPIVHTTAMPKDDTSNLNSSFPGSSNRPHENRTNLNAPANEATDTNELTLPPDNIIHF